MLGILGYFFITNFTFTLLLKGPSYISEAPIYLRHIIIIIKKDYEIIIIVLLAAGRRNFTFKTNLIAYENY